MRDDQESKQKQIKDRKMGMDEGNQRMRKRQYVKTRKGQENEWQTGHQGAEGGKSD